LILSWLGLALGGGATLVFLATLGLRRTLPTGYFHTAILASLGLAVAGAVMLGGDPWWPIAASGVLTVGWFGITGKELGLPRGGALRIQKGGRLPDVTLVSTDGKPVMTAEIVARAPALIVLYRGWW
jgi:hypothetical protein